MADMKKVEKYIWDITSIWHNGTLVQRHYLGHAPLPLAHLHRDRQDGGARAGRRGGD